MYDSGVKKFFNGIVGQRQDNVQVPILKVGVYFQPLGGRKYIGNHIDRACCIGTCTQTALFSCNTQTRNQLYVLLSVSDSSNSCSCNAFKIKRCIAHSFLILIRSSLVNTRASMASHRTYVSCTHT